MRVRSLALAVAGRATCVDPRVLVANVGHLEQVGVQPHSRIVSRKIGSWVRGVHDDTITGSALFAYPLWISFSESPSRYRSCSRHERRWAASQHTGHGGHVNHPGNVAAAAANEHADAWLVGRRYWVSGGYSLGGPVSRATADQCQGCGCRTAGLDDAVRDVFWFGKSAAHKHPGRVVSTGLNGSVWQKPAHPAQCQPPGPVLGSRLHADAQHDRSNSSCTAAVLGLVDQAQVVAGRILGDGRNAGAGVLDAVLLLRPLK